MTKEPELNILATRWGYKGTVSAFCGAVKKEGYEGIEADWPADQEAQNELFGLLKKHQLEVGFLCDGWQKDVNEHLDTFTKKLQAAANNPHQKPLYINCHSGKDYYSLEDGCKFIDAAAAVHQQTGIPIYHETHRGRLMFNAPVTKQYLQLRPGLVLNADFSHWCNVHESLLEDQEETMELVLPRCGHIHARIGHPEGPQVNDPRAPEWKETVERHAGWWDKIIQHKMARGENKITILTEFGPPNYLPVLPYTQQPISDQWEINVYMKDFLRKRYGGQLKKS